MRVLDTVGQGEKKPAVRDHRFRIAAIACPAMKLGVRAQVLLAAPTKRADAAGEAQPCRADPHARRERPDRGADFRYAADDFVTRNDSWRAPRQVAVDDVEVGAANAAGAYLDDDVGRLFRCGPGAPPTNQRRADCLADHRRIGLWQGSSPSTNSPLPILTVRDKGR